LANNALAIRIIFPSVRVIQVSFNLTGLPASLGKQKRVQHGCTLYFIRPEISGKGLFLQSGHLTSTLVASREASKPFFRERAFYRQ